MKSFCVGDLMAHWRGRCS